jgi:polyisoprenoid-binding protein YceI
LSAAAHAPARGEIGPGRWAVDAAASRVGFEVKHMLVSRLRGGFGRFEGALKIAEDGSASAQGSVEVASFDTGDDVRDERVRASSELFDAASHPRLTFESSSLEQQGGRVRVKGPLQMRGVTREIALEGSARAARDGQTISLSLSGVLDRKDFGIVWSETLDAGGALVGDEVKILLDLRLRDAARR